MSAIELTMDDVHRDMQAVHDWLVAHDLEPDRTTPGVVIREGQVTATLYVVDEQGNKQLEPDVGDGPARLATVEVTMPLRCRHPAGLGTAIP